ncbi:MAG: hypothetical protein DWG81_04910 [Chloroflexi bacterium]|nr:hypothetical protein [Chloroflexota bacterium]
MSHSDAANWRALQAAGQGARAFAVHLKRFEAIVLRASAQTARGLRRHLAVRCYLEDLRTPAFMLQGLGRVYRKVLPHAAGAVVERQRLIYKGVEDTLGEFDAWHTLLVRAQMTWRAPTEVQAWFHDNRMHAAGRVDAALHFLKLTPEDGGHGIAGGARNIPALVGIRAECAELPWPADRKDRKKVARFLADELREIEEQCESGTLNLRDLEGGLHELRRRLRWPSVYAAALNGLVVIGPQNAAAPGLTHYFTAAVTGSRHAHMPRNRRVAQPLEINYAHWMALSWLIQELGLLKDRRQWTAALKAALSGSGARPGRALAQMLGKDFSTAATTARTATNAIERLVLKERVLGCIANELDRQK